MSLSEKLNPQFLREVSRYLIDLRLIRNIFNEYAIYVRNIEGDNESSLDANKLLAVLIYKNVFPSDFENLHRERGNLAAILRGHEQYIAATEARYAAEIAEREREIDEGERQLPNDLAELRRIYAMAIVEIVPEPYTRVGTDRNATIALSGLANDERFEAIVEAKQLYLVSAQGQVHHLRNPEWQAKIDPHRTYRERKADVEKKSAAFKEASFKKIRDLRHQLAAVRMSKFNELVRENEDQIDRLFRGFGEGADLARYLVLEGYLDDTYYQYTSLFHSGRLSPSDNKFLILIRSFRTPDPNFQIDNPNEVIAAMRDEDFSRSYVLNVTIVDCLLGDPQSYATQTERLLQFIASSFDSCEKFLASYYASGVAVTALISGLAKTWADYIPTAVASAANLTHVARIIGHLSDADMKALAKKQPALADFVSKRLPDILGQGVDFPIERLQSLNIKATDLAALEARPGVVQVLFDEGLYELSIDNLNFIFRAVLGINDGDAPRERNYTLALGSGSAPLLAKIDTYFNEYLHNVLLRLPDNHRESISAVLKVVGRDDLDNDPIIEFIEKQSILLPALDQVPETLHVALFRLEKIEPTWDNCIRFLESAAYDADVLTKFLNSATALHTLPGQKIPEDELAEKLRKFVFNNDGLSDEAYRAYVGALPRQFNAFPEHVGSEKTKILVDLNAITFSPAALSQLDADPLLGVTFVKRNMAKFFEVHGECSLDDDFRHMLLEADISDEDRLKIIEAMDLNLLPGLPSRAAVIGGTMARAGMKVRDLGVDAARAVIFNSRPLATQVTLLNMLQSMFDDQQIKDILGSLPDPLNDIKPGFAMPRLENNQANRELATWLKDRGFISSWRQGGLFDNDIRLNMFRK